MIKIMLSPREQEVLRLMAQGYSNKSIARMLNVEIRTVERHCSNIYDEMGLHNNPDTNIRVIVALTYQGEA